MENKIFEPAFSYKLIYIFRINDTDHIGKLKIGEATVHTIKPLDELYNNCEELNYAARNRINDYTTTAGIKYELLHTEIAVTNDNKVFKDTNVHDVLLRSGYERFYFDTERKQNEWFIVNLDVAKNAIKAVKEGRLSLNSNEKNYVSDPIILRPEQEEAVKKTIAQFSKSNNMLWNAKMRFGKTISALEIVRREKFNKTIILTHRPVVDHNWYEDFEKIFIDSEYLYGSRKKGESLDNLLSFNKPFVYFASIQDLRGSKEVGGKFEKNELVFNTNWDFVVIDEAHEGTKTEKGETTLEGVIKINNDYPTKILKLSGTAFNLLEDYNEDEIYTWDYIMEQEAKQNWYINHFGDSNPYEELPELKIYTYDLNKLLPGYEAVYDTAFNFKEFFRVWTGDVEKDGREMPDNASKGQFMYEADVNKFLDLMCRSDNDSNYPYSNELYREYFRHSLWMIPGVKEAKALSKLLNNHSVFGSGQFNIINIAGEGDEEKQFKEAYDAVKNGIGPNPDDTYSITLSCGKMTTGVTVKPWTAVFMLSGSSSTSASSYLQTIFRVQSPANIGGKMKEKCYVFDFAPDRSLKMISYATKISIKVGDTSNNKMVLGKFLNFCPVISINGSKMIPYNVESMMGQLKKAYAERVVSNGFDDRYIYNDNILKLDENALQKFKELEEIVGASKPTKKTEKIDINKQGFTNEEYEQIRKIENKPKNELSEEDRKRLEELREKRKQANTAISILRAISIRIPLLIYGADIEDNEDITVDNLTKIVDDESWLEFMPKGVTKEKFRDFSQYYEQDVFVEAGRKIRRSAKYADTLSPTERVKEIASIFSSFRNPDKETVLTPWKTVNMHLGDTIGGYNFYDKKYENGEYKIFSIEEPRYITYGEVTQNVLNNSQAKILEINSKSGLYPLYIAYSLFRQKCLDTDSKKLTDELENTLWNEVVRDNIFVLCKTPMAKTITDRTLRGYTNVQTNAKYDFNLLKNMIESSEDYLNIINNPKYWEKEGDKMNFEAIVGNPPYNILDGGGGSSAKPIYNYFVTNSMNLNPNYISMIIPSRWFTGGKGLNEFRTFMINNKKIRILHDYIDSKECFSNVSIEGGVCYFLWNKNEEGLCKIYNHLSNGEIKIQERFLSEDDIDVVIRDDESLRILKKVLNCKEESFSKIVLSRNAFKIDQDIEKFISKDKTNLRILARIDNCRQRQYLNANFTLTKNEEIVNKYKIFISKADGAAGQLGNPVPAKIIGKPELGYPNDICTETFLVVGSFNTEVEMINVEKYLKTKFSRFLIGIRKNKNMTADTYKFVPMQNFIEDSDINWKKSIKDIDYQLYQKYMLTDNEVEYIEKMIKDI